MLGEAPFQVVSVPCLTFPDDEDSPSKLPQGFLVLAIARGTRVMLGLSAVATALAVSLLTPLLWTTWRPRWLLWPLESYIDGVHNLGQPQAWLFPIFPWSGFGRASPRQSLLLCAELPRT